MTTKNDTRTATLDEIEKRAERGELLPRRAGKQPELPPEFWREARSIAERERKTAISLRIDAETAEFFRSEGRGHLTRMANVLKAYARARKAGR